MSSISRGGLIGRLLDEFELTWKQAPPASIEEYYGRVVRTEARVLDAANRTTLLEELVKLDLEFRWRPGSAAREKWGTRDYAQRFAELRVPGWDAVPLLCEEFRVRWQWGDRPGREGFCSDYVHLEPRLSTRLSQVEQSLRGAPFPPPPVSLSRTGPHVPRPSATDVRPAAKPADTAFPAIPGYEIKSVLGKGGMGVVYKAWDTGLKRHVALKLILTGGDADEQEMARFRLEAQSIAKLKHPNIVQIFAYGEFENRPYFALEFLEGGSLSRYLGNAPQPPAAAAALAEAIARGMETAHRAGIVHRDLKPANVLLEWSSPKGRSGAAPEIVAKITDFGLAKQLDDDGDKTHAGAIMGTPSYMAIEQAEGRIQDVGPPADIYAIGAILYEMLIGRPPFKGASVVETLDLVRHRDPVSPRLLQPSVPLDLETICLKCLRKDTTQRYASAEALADDLGRFRRGEPILARPVGSLEQAWKFYRRNPRVVYAGTGIVVLLLLTIVATGIAAAASSARAAADLRKANAETEALTAKGEKDAAELAKVKAEAEKQIQKARDEKTIKSQDYDLLIGISERELSSPKGDIVLAEKMLDACRPEYRGWEWKYLVRKCDGGRQEFSGHEAGLWSVAYHPRGDEIATASIDGTVRLWDVKTQRETAVLTAHKADVGKVIAGAKGLNDLQKTIALGQAKSSIETAMNAVSVFAPVAPKIPPVPTAFNPGDIPEHLSPVIRVAYSSDGRYLASGALDPKVDGEMALRLAKKEPLRPVGTVIVWDRERNSHKVFPMHKTLILALACRPGSDQIASAGMDDEHAWKLRDRESGAVAHTFLGHKGWIVQARFSPDGRYVATGSADGTAILWDVSAKTAKHKFGKHRATVHDVAFSKDGTQLATAGTDGNVYLWDLTLPDPASAEPVQLRGHIGAALGVAFSPDGTRVATAGFDRTVRVWDPKSGAELPPGAPKTADEKITLRGHANTIWSIAFSPDGSKLVSASFDGTARIWDSSPAVEPAFPGAFTLRNSPEKPDEDHRVNRIAFSTDGSRMATASWDGAVSVWDAKNGAAIRKLEHEGPVWGVAFSPNGERILSGSWDTTVRLWNAATGKEEKRWVLKSPVQSVAYSHNGEYVCAGGWDGTVKVWNAETGKEVSPIKGHYLPVFSMAFTPDDRYLATAGGDRTAKLWPLAGGEPAVLAGHGATVFTVTIDKAGRQIATAGWDNSVRLWRFDNGRATFDKELNNPKTGHKDYVCGVAFRPDGKQLATTGLDKTLCIWDPESGNSVVEPKSLRGVSWDVAYHPDGTRLAAAVWNPKSWVKILPATQKK
ncbi:protein kinase domain-containing protein [Fimbriiglobus ruber]|uniref:High-affnity carbon uptake protein Hat/HatR n=1 Tax=Fimbriiglobus ruber TaxID=1908690 RepID=A0A225DH09_9BACT|nr:protein kinase [Fimbriiglobus ruber]OWK37818.1 High-affnity carbon uptake protein Hat/HatR [Fimbriiglobus ruber]